MNINKTIPQSVKAALWSYDLDKIDLERHKKIIIFQVLNYGNSEATDWLRKNYSKEEIIQAVALVPRDQWDKKSLALWSLYLGIKPALKSERVNAR